MHKNFGVKERTYRMEEMFFSPFAQKSAQSRGRAREEDACDMRTDFQRDRDRIIYSKAFLRLKNKTQVFFRPKATISARGSRTPSTFRRSRAPFRAASRSTKI